MNRLLFLLPVLSLTACASDHSSESPTTVSASIPDLKIWLRRSRLADFTFLEGVRAIFRASTQRYWMWRVPYFLLVLGSVTACGLWMVRISLNHQIRQQQDEIAVSQQLIASGPDYETTWKNIAAGIYQASAQDPALTELLRRHDITVRVNAPSTASPSAFAPLAPTNSAAPAAPFAPGQSAP